MKILMLGPQPFFEPRGTPISIYQRLEMLSRLGHQVDLLTYHLGTEVSIPGVELHRTANLRWITEVRIGPSYAKLLLDILMFFKAIKMLASNRYDAIHSHEEAAFFCPILSAIFATPHLYDMHSNLPRQLENSRYGRWRPLVWLFELFEKWVVKTSEVIITIGSDLEARVKQINPKAVQFLIENLPLTCGSASPQELTAGELKQRLRINGSSPVVYTGSFESYQGLDLLLETAQVLRHSEEQIIFVMVGGLPDQVQLWQQKVAKHQLEKMFRFTGTVPTNEITAYLELADILVSPRVSGTSIPLKIYAYLQAGKPTLATNIEAHTEVLNDEIALLVETTPESFSDGVLKLVRSPGLRKKLGAKAKDFASRRYDPEKQAAKLALAYQALLQDSPASKRATYPRQTT